MNILWFNEVNMKSIEIVGGKNASLGEMINNLTSFGISVPNGFAITTDAYKKYIKFNDLYNKITSTLKTIDTTNIEDLPNAGGP